VLRKITRKYLERQTKKDDGKQTAANESMESPDIETPALKKDETAPTPPEVTTQGLVTLVDASKINEAITDKTIQKYLGARRFRIGSATGTHEVGLCNGLAWTEVGGDLLVAEVTILPGKGKLICTGKLGEVMQESAQAALSYVRSRATFLSLDEDFYQKIDIHIHVPEGAIPKDGPSAGIAMATALTSALTGRPVSKDVAMTGEITLRGRVLPIGGLKEKLIAAHRAGLKKVIIPKENEKDLEDVPKQILKELSIVGVEHMDPVLIHALVWKQPGSEERDELFEKLRKITESEVNAGELSFAH
jgi:ATP-dependent Lon protease